MDKISTNYLPEFLRNIDGNITSANLKCLKTADGRYVQTYSVTWAGQNNGGTTTAQSSTPEGFWGFLKKLLPNNPISNTQMARCDGPCNQMKSLNNMKQIGLCEHIVCQQCLEDPKKVSIKDGGSGCPNVECYEEDLAVLKRLKLAVLKKVDKYCVDKPTSKMRDMYDGNLCSKNCVKAKSCEPETCIARGKRQRNCMPSKVCQQPLKNAMLDRDERNRVASITTTTDHETPERNVCLTSGSLNAQLPNIYDNINSSILKKVHLRVTQDGKHKWLEDDITGDCVLLEALKIILKNHQINPSKNSCTHLSLVPYASATPIEWNQLTEKDMTLPLKRISEDEEIYLALNIST